MGYLLDQRSKYKGSGKKDLSAYPPLIDENDKRMHGALNRKDKADYEKFKREVSDPIKRESC